MPQDPQLLSLQRPEKLSDALKADKAEDCLSCRLIGELQVCFSGNHLVS